MPESTTADGTANQTAHRSGLSSPLFERDNELSKLDELARAARAGHGSIALIAGEAGIGKTSLVDAFRHDHRGTLKILSGWNDPLATPRPYGPIFDMSENFSPELKGLIRSGAPKTEVFNAVFAEISGLSPASVVIVEDAHWADQASLDLLKYLGRRISALSCLMVMTYRDDEVGFDHPLTVLLGEFPHTRVHRLTPKPLTPSAMACLASCDIEDARTLHDATNGNPFFVSEMIGASGALPGSIRDAIGSKVARLPAEERAFLETLCASPNAVPSALLHLVFGDKATELAISCVSKGMLIEQSDGSFRFRHELARIAILDRVSRKKSFESHRRFLEALAHKNEPEFIAQQVHHADGARNPSEVMRVAPLAAEKASQLSAHAEAFAYAGVALKYVDHAGPEVAAPLWELWAGSACVSTSMGNEVIDGRSEAARLWNQLGRPEKAAENLRWRSRLHWYRCEPEQANAFAEEAIELLQATNEPAELALSASLRAQLLMLKLEMDEAIQWGGNALQLARSVNALEAEVHALNTIGAAKSFQNDPEGIELLKQSLALAESTSYGEYAAHDGDIARAYLNMADHAAEFRKFELAEEVISAGVKRCTEIDFEAWVYQLHGRRAQVFLDQGRISDAKALAEKVLQYGAITPQVALVSKLVMARISSLQGAHDAFEFLNECLEDARQGAETNYEISTRLALIEFAWINNNPGLAMENLGALDEVDAKYLHVWNEGTYRIWSRVFRADNRSVKHARFPDCLSTDLSGDIDAAVESYLSAGLVLDAVLCLLRNSKFSPAQHLVKAAEKLSELECPALLQRCHQLAQAFGVQSELPGPKRGPYRHSRDHPLGLTKKEVEVLAFVAGGATNKEISEKLHRSHRTIDHHVSSMLKKLNVTSRIDLVLRVANEPWIVDSRQVERTA